jgi:hypothetical protein
MDQKRVRGAAYNGREKNTKIVRAMLKNRHAQAIILAEQFISCFLVLHFRVVPKSRCNIGMVGATMASRIECPLFCRSELHMTG